MKITKTDVVYRDKETAATYTKEYAMMPIAVVLGSEPTSTFGVLLKPYDNLVLASWNEPDQGPDLKALRKQYGYVPGHPGQSILVSEELFASRFECLGRKSYEIDLAAQLRQYEEENCDFSNKAAVARDLLKHAGEGMGGAQLYAVLKDFLEPGSEKS